eukprot:CCRYP_011963-RB/>CCRYP_011963-RB protein AED:0.40 eAED:0.67 QI:0/0/0.2/1/0/0/5/139/556
METEYLGYRWYKTTTKKVQAILALTPPQNVKQLRRFLGMVQYYRDIWARRSEILAPLTNLVGIHNTVADAISRLDYGPVTDDRSTWMTFAQCWCYHNTSQPEASLASTQESMNQVFANRNEEDSIYPLTTREIAEAQQEDESLLNKGYSTQLVENIKVLCKEGKMVIPTSLQHRAVAWFCHYLQHPGTKRLEETLRLSMYWKGLRTTVQSHVKKCHSCQVNKRRQIKYGKLPTKLAITNPWEALCVHLIGPSSYKKLFLGTSLGEKLRAMSSVKAIPKGLKWVECERGVGGKNSPIRYIPEQDPVQDALAKDKKTTYFKLTLPNTGNELKVAVWASGTPEQFLLHVRSAIHACKQMGPDTDFAAAEKAVETAKIEAELAKQDYVTVRNAEKKKKGNKQEAPGMTTEAASPALVEAKATYDKVLKALEDVKLAVAMAGAKPFELYGNLLSDEARQPSEKIIKAQVTKAPWEDIKGVPHTETPTKTWNSFHECVTFHLLQVFRHDAGEALKYYITNMLKKPNRIVRAELKKAPRKKSSKRKKRRASDSESDSDSDNSS